MKKLTMLFVVVLSLLLISACVPLPAETPTVATEETGPQNAAVQGFVDLPDNVEFGITSVVVWLVSWAFTQLVLLIPFLSFLDDFKQPISLALAGQLIALIEMSVPDAFGGVAVAGIVLLLSILALFKVGEVLQYRGVRGFR